MGSTMLAGRMALLALAACASTQAMAGNRATATGTASATLVDPITLRAVEALQFGVLAVSENGSGAITVDPDSGTSIFAGAVGSICPAGAGCFARPALFAVTGEAGRHYRINAPATAMALHENAGSSLAVNSITLSQGLVRRTLDDGGQDSFKVGGTLAIPAGTPPGIYTAELAVVVSYD